MNDRFKFRTYIPDLKFFKYWGWIEDSHYVGLCACGDCQMPELLEKYTNQCTGLKDKNSKLIYEGDILQDKYGALHPISWNIKGFFEADTFAIAGFYSAIQEDMEVIGNIYENKELLNETNTDNPV